ncbi:MAG: BON domain-containing protein [Pseudomonadota bacterium]
MNKTGRYAVRPLLRGACALALLATLSGCVEMIVGGAVVGAMATADRRTYGAQTEDQAIAVKAEVRVPKIAGEGAHVNINSYNRRVLLTGEVKDEATKAAVQREVAAIEGVQAVANELEVSGVSSYTSRSSDTLLTTKVKASLIEVKTISANSFKVVSERGTVFLMGRVTMREGNVASDIARSVRGVQKVVKVLDYITEEELRTISVQPAAPAAKE